MNDGIEPPPLLDPLAAWAAQPDLALPKEAARQARLCLLDTLGVMIAGRQEAVCQAAYRAMLAAGAAGPALTLAGPEGLSAPAAALVNGAAAHALDFDDYEQPGTTHCSAPLLPPLLALSDLKTVTFGEVLRAYLVGFETIVQLAALTGGYRHYMAGWHSTATLGAVGAAAGAARLLSAPAEGMLGAITLACSLASGVQAQFGSQAKPLHAGFAARAGAEAALLASEGLSGNPRVLEAPRGFQALFGGDPSVVPAAPGAVTAIERWPPSRKPWPACAYTHRAIEAALTLAREPGFDSAAIADIAVSMPEPFFRICSIAASETPGAARFSVLYCVACALTDGTLGPESFTAEAIARPEVAALRAKARALPYEPAGEIEDMSPDHPDRVTLTLKDGSTRSVTIAKVLGGLDRPMDREALLTKFHACGGSESLSDWLLTAPEDAPFRFGSLPT